MSSRFDYNVANQYASEKKWIELKDYLRQFSSEDLEDVVGMFIKLENKVIDLIKQNRYSAVASVFTDDIILLLKTSKIDNLVDHMFYLHGQVNTRYMFFGWILTVRM